MTDTPPASGPDGGVVALQAALSAGRLTSVALVQQCLERIASIDRAGPCINSVLEANPDALAIAAALDAERAAGTVRGPLHGIPVLLKDNIATADRMRTSAGSLALADVSATRDAGIVRRLRNAGVVILGKTNLSEWANFRASRSVSGWSGRGGLTLNPYALDRSASGSSSGSAAAVASGLAPFAVGTETDGSIVEPASVCGLVGIKPTVGLVSRAGIVPIAASQDTAGPMCRSVADSAALLTVLAGADPDDGTTAEAGTHAIDFTRALDADALRGARIGVARDFFGRNERVTAVIEAALDVMRARGAVIVDPVVIGNTRRYRANEALVMEYEFKAGVSEYLRIYAPHAAIASVADIVAFNVDNAARELQWFGQDRLVAAAARGGVDSDEYLAALANNRRYARAEGLDLALEQHALDALLAPTCGVAWLIDFINGDAGTGSFSTPAAVAGYPHITVPAGFVQGLPVGVSLTGGAFSEARLIGLAYAFEQATHAWRPPGFAATVVGGR